MALLDISPAWGHVDDHGFYRVSDWELVTGWVGGFEPAVRLPDPGPRGARQCFEDALLEALQRKPCLVAFSGGRDSSAVLCVATHVARREGLPDPIPVTHDFSEHGPADETRWQELVVRHLRLEDWQRVNDPDAFDVLGARAQAGLARFGLLWPALVHCHTPFVELAAGGGSLVTGEGGDEILGPQRLSPLGYALRSRKCPDRKLLGLVAVSLSPRWVARMARVQEMANTNIHPWLSDGAARAFLHQDAHDNVDFPLRWDRAVGRHLARRGTVMGSRNTRLVMAKSDVTLHEPFLAPSFVAAWCRQGGPRGYVSRTGMMRRLFGDIVPEEITNRQQKASFGTVAIGRESRAFLRDWHGEGVDASIVDVARFCQACEDESPFFAVQLLLQSAWLASRAPEGRPSGRAVPAGAPSRHGEN